MTDELQPQSPEPESESQLETEAPQAKIEDPIGDETDGEGRIALDEGPEEEPEESADAENEPQIAAEEDKDEPQFNPKPRPPAKLERLQKILAQAGVASRRKAEEMIEQGRVHVNGKIVTELGTKADAGRDHIRVDGKLLQGAERLRYFVLNKPRGFVTTVKDPEGRPTVMQFFDKMRERLYPVGRLDYMSEGLLLVTNDGELANRLTRASAGVEKTYLVKVAGQPTEDELDILRGGVSIEKGKPGAGRVRTSPARIRQVRQGDNPWYEVVLIEGRNRELRKMFEEVGHFVEKIRRVGYGPLILDQEPGNLRELDENELSLLRKAADGKLRTPKAKEVRRRNIADSLPPEKPAFRPKSSRPPAGSKDYRGKKAFDLGKPAAPGKSFAPRPDADESRPFRPGRPAAEGFRSSANRGDDRPRRISPTGSRPGSYTPKPGFGRPADRLAARPAWKKDDRPVRPPARFAEGAGGEGSRLPGKTFGNRPSTGRTYGAKPAAGKTFGAKPAARRPFGDKPTGKPYGAKPAAGRTFGAKPAWNKSTGSDRAPFKRPAAPRREVPEPMEDLGPRKPTRLHIEPVQESERTERTRPGQSGAGRSGSNRPSPNRSGPGRSSQSGGSSARPFRSEGGLGRPFTTSSGKPRAGGARPSSKPGGRTYGGASSSRGGPRGGAESRPSFGPKRPFAPRTEGASDSRPRSEGARAEHRTGTGWKPKPNFGSTKPGGGTGSKPRTGGFSKGGYKAKPSGSGPKRTGARPGGKRPGGAGGGKKRG